MELDQRYWNDRYLNNTAKWDLGQISTPIKEYVDGITNKNVKILIPGAGNSYEAEYLHKIGFSDITVIDIASEPLLNLESRLPKSHNLKLIKEDFFNHQGNYDLIIEQTFLCALELRFRESYPIKMSDLLNSSGILAGVLFTIDKNRSEPPFGGTMEEYRKLFEPLFKIETLEPCYNSVQDRKNKEVFIQFEKK